MDSLVTAKELAVRLRVKPTTIHSWRRRGLIPCLQASRRPVLFDLTAVERVLAERGRREQEAPYGGEA